MFVLYLKFVRCAAYPVVSAVKIACHDFVITDCHGDLKVNDGFIYINNENGFYISAQFYRTIISTLGSSDNCGGPTFSASNE